MYKSHPPHKINSGRPGNMFWAVLAIINPISAKPKTKAVVSKAQVRYSLF
jgi:hypothetical protein